MYRSAILFLALTFSPAVVAAQQPCTPDARQVVNELYRHILERGADAGSHSWVAHFERGGTVREVVRAIVTSDEHQQRFWKQEAGEDTPYIRAVGTMYRHILGRQPDDAGARAWAAQTSRSGMDSIADRIINSAEYNQQYGDWGVPGTGGLRYCGRENQGVSQVAPARQIDQRRFGGMDSDNDGRITRNEWRGNRQAFENQDWNNDGVLSGDEVDAAAGRFGRGRVAEDVNPRRAQRFDNLDINGNSRLEPREWDGTVAAFNRLDANHDNVLSRAEFLDTGVAEEPVVGTSGDSVRVEGTQPWTDTGITVRAGDTITFDAQGSVQISNNRNDIAGAGGTLSGRREADAPLSNQVAGALIARIGNSPPLFIGNRRSVRAPFDGRLYLGVNDNHLEDNSGDFQVMVIVDR